MNTFALTATFTRDVTNNYKELTKVEEYHLIAEAQKGSEKAQNLLINSQLPAIINIARAYLNANPRNEMGDLVGDGTLGLIDAINRFDPSFGVRLYSFAQRIIADHIRNASVDNQTVRNSREKSKSKKLKEGEHLMYHPDEVEKINGEWRLKPEIFPTKSLDHKVMGNSSEPSKLTFADVFADPHARADEHTDAFDVSKVLSILNSDERELVERVHGLNGNNPTTLADIGRETGKSRQVMFLKMQKIMKKLRKDFAEEV